MTSAASEKKLKADLLELKVQLDTHKNNNTAIPITTNASYEPHLITSDVNQNIGSIKHLGDVFIGIKNTSKFFIDITLRFSNDTKEKLTIAPGAIYQAFEGYPVPQFYKGKDIYYEIKKTRPADFFYSIFVTPPPISAQFIYGNVSPDVGTILKNGCIFINYTQNNKEKSLFLCSNKLHDSLYEVCDLYPDHVNDNFSSLFFNNVHNSDVMQTFKKMNPHWIQLTTKLK